MLLCGRGQRGCAERHARHDRAERPAAPPVRHRERGARHRRGVLPRRQHRRSSRTVGGPALVRRVRRRDGGGRARERCWRFRRRRCRRRQRRRPHAPSSPNVRHGLPGRFEAAVVWFGIAGISHCSSARAGDDLSASSSAMGRRARLRCRSAVGRRCSSRWASSTCTPAPLAACARAACCRRMPCCCWARRSVQAAAGVHGHARDRLLGLTGAAASVSLGGGRRVLAHLRLRPARAARTQRPGAVGDAGDADGGFAAVGPVLGGTLVKFVGLRRAWASRPSCLSQSATVYVLLASCRARPAIVPASRAAPRR